MIICDRCHATTENTEIRTFTIFIKALNFQEEVQLCIDCCADFDREFDELLNHYRYQAKPEENPEVETEEE